MALAFAVAALQRGENPGVCVSAAAAPSLFSVDTTTTSSSKDKNTNPLRPSSPSSFFVSSQSAGSGSEEKMTENGTSSSSSSSSSSTNNEEEEETSAAEMRLAKSRERNREHARRTRLRKKAQMEALQSKVKGLEAERQVLKQRIEDCSIASILLGLGSSSSSSSSATTTDTTTPSEDDSSSPLLSQQEQHMIFQTNKKSRGDETSIAALLTSSSSSGGRRRRFLSEEHQIHSQPLKVLIDGTMTEIGGHVNWKTGVYKDTHGVQRQLTADQLKTLRRERNRMHAKLTRDRKKCFIAVMEKTIDDLQADVDQMKNVLSKVSSGSRSSQLVTPATSPGLTAVPGPKLDDDEEKEEEEPAPKRARHGFVLGD